MIPRYKSEDALSRKASIGTLLKIFGRFIRFLLPYWDKMSLALLVNQANAFIWLVPPLLGIRIVDEVFPQKNWHLGVTLTLASFGVGFFAYWLGFVNSYVYTWVHMFVGYRIQFDFLRHLQKLSITFYESRPVGEHLQRATWDPSVVEGIVVDTIPNAINPFQMLFASLAVIATIKPMLAWMCAIFILPYVVGQHFLITWKRNVTKIQLARYQEQQARYVELLGAFKTTRALNREATERRKYWTTWMRSKRVDWTLFWIGFVQDNSINQYYNVFTGIVVPLVTIWWVIGEKMTVGEYMAAGWIVSQFLNPIQSLASFFQDLRTNLVYAERLLDTLEVEPDMVDEQHAHHLPARIEGRIQLEHVSYSYPGRPGVLHHIDLTIEPGQKVALVGPSGAGKSTLLGLICRFYNPTEGRVSIDGHDLRSLTRASLMAHIAVCLQDTIVLMGSVADNIWYGGRNPTQQQIEHAAKLAGIHDFIVSLPDGYDTQLGEGGQQLSGGQIQRIGLARALARDPRIILFDEVTSDMDPLLHREVLGTLRDACKGRTVIMVSHDLVDIMDADLIGVLDSTGEIAQRGRHGDLMAAPGLYREMWYEEAVGRGSGGVA